MEILTKYTKVHNMLDPCMFTFKLYANPYLYTTARCVCVYPLLLSARTKAFMPHFVGLSGMYWMKYSRPLKPIMDSSTATSRPSSYAALKFSNIGSMNGLSLYSGSYPGWPLGMYLLLSLRCRKRRIKEKRSRFKIEEKVGIAKGHLVDQPSSMLGS